MKAIVHHNENVGQQQDPFNINNKIVEARRRKLAEAHAKLAARQRHAICVRDANKQYGLKSRSSSSRSSNMVLDGLNMTVERGSIYGLLGASGCGKTTLLSCIVGRRRLDSGDIWVLGGRCGSRASGVPGPKVGYMPQEVALYVEFSIRETLIYFGWISGMQSADIKQRIGFLMRLLDLEDDTKYIKHLSGGQQRRVSLAATLIHEPELLILDEPTVGVDPILRKNVWEHLMQISRLKNRTVIITTHYIEEARQANVIGLMRGGKFLAEQSPEALMRAHACNNLEDVFLKLSRLQKNNSDESIEETKPEANGSAFKFKKEIAATITFLESDNAPSMSCCERICIFKSQHMRALIWKNVIWMGRNFAFTAFCIGLPILQALVFCLAIGEDPKNLRLSVVNYELHNVTTEFYQETLKSCPFLPSNGCSKTFLGCKYLRVLGRKSYQYDLYDNETEASDEVQRGQSYASLTIGSNFSATLVERTHSHGGLLEMDTWNASDIDVRLDMSNKIIAMIIYRDLQYAYFELVEEFSADCRVYPIHARLPMRFEKPVYGGPIEMSKYSDFVASGFILSCCYFFAVGMSTVAMMIERNGGTLERALVTGVTSIEIQFAFLISMFLVTLFQVMQVVIVVFVLFDRTLVGSMVSVIMLGELTALCGICFGLMISTLCETERNATYIGLGSLFPMVALCGVFWPIEGMYPPLRMLAQFLPLTKSTEAVRSITIRGWAISMPKVYEGFLTTIAWICLFLIISMIGTRFKRV